MHICKPRENPRGGGRATSPAYMWPTACIKSTQTPKRLRSTIVRVNPKAHMLTPSAHAINIHYEEGKAVHICAAACTKRVRDPPANRRPRNQNETRGGRRCTSAPPHVRPTLHVSQHYGKRICFAEMFFKSRITPEHLEMPSKRRQLDQLRTILLAALMA